MAYPKRALMIMVGVVAAAAIFVAVAVFSGNSEGMVPIERAHPIGDGQLLVYGSAEDASRVRSWSTVGVLGTDGVLRHSVHDQAKIDVVGVGADVVWLDHHEHGLQARRLPTLELVPGISEAVAQHPVLSNGVRAKGVADGAVVVTGKDQKEYTIAQDGTIERAGKGLALQSWPHTVDPDAKNELGFSFKQASKIATSVDEFTHPVVVGETTPMSVDDPPSFFVRSLAYSTAGQTQTLHRVSLDGQILWTVSVEQLMDAMEAEGQHIGLAWAGPLDGNLTAIAQLSEFHRTEDASWSEHVQQLVTINGETGEILQSRPITRPPES